jgi:hypothetical protein
LQLISLHLLRLLIFGAAQGSLLSGFKRKPGFEMISDEFAVPGTGPGFDVLPNSKNIVTDRKYRYIRMNRADLRYPYGFEEL